MYLENVIPAVFVGYFHKTVIVLQDNIHERRVRQIERCF
jgi:hypothetical protein